jgi:hypothetical protein
VREDGWKLNNEQAKAFHHTLHQLLVAANQARRDIQTAVSFLTTRVLAPNEETGLEVPQRNSLLKVEAECQLIQVQH